MALAGLEPDLLRDVAAECGDAPWQVCDVRNAGAIELCLLVGHYDMLATTITALRIPLDKTR